MRFAGPWGDSRARAWLPPEQDSPHGPASSPPAGTPTRSRPAPAPARPSCDAVGECDAPEKAVTAAAVVLPLALLAVVLAPLSDPHADAAE